MQAIVYVAAQLLGGLAAWQLSEFLLNQPLRNVAGDSLDWRVLTAEAVGAFVFTFGVAAAVSKAYEQVKLAMVVGASLTLGIMVASLASNGVVNPAVAIGIQSWGWAYVLGPVAGALVGMNLYGLIFAPLDKPTPRGVKAVAAKVTKRGKRATSKKK